MNIVKQRSIYSQMSCQTCLGLLLALRYLALAAAFIENSKYVSQVSPLPHVFSAELKQNPWKIPRVPDVRGDQLQLSLVWTGADWN